MTFFRKAWYIARKDILAELRTREMISTMGAFSVLVILLFAFAFDLNRHAILLCAGNKAGVSTKRFCRRLIERADRLFDAHLRALRADKRGR